MSDEKSSNRAPWATILSTAAVTVAVGVTVAALGGYLVPARDRPEPAAELADPVAPAAATEPPPPPASSPANIVLVPVAPDTPAAPVAPDTPPADVAAEPPLVFASHDYEREDDDEDEDEEDEHDDD